ncbi:hypothetical protein DB347_04890 [Opitutaceae bacterium EW11]|nr:hypothetical protein DB347_04890 [Opitutaceae bacterium EW11]
MQSDHSFDLNETLQRPQVPSGAQSGTADASHTSAKTNRANRRCVSIFFGRFFPQSRDRDLQKS